MKTHQSKQVVGDAWFILINALRKGWKSAGYDPIGIIHPHEFDENIVMEVVLHPFVNPTPKQMQLMPVGGGCSFQFLEHDKVRVKMQISDPNLMTTTPFINHFLWYRQAVQRWNAELLWEVTEKKERYCTVSWKEAYFIIKEIGDAIQKDVLYFPPVWRSEK